MADNPNSAISKALGVPFDKAALKKHPQTGMTYVEGHTYIHRLIDATENTWDWHIVRQDFHPYGMTKGRDGKEGNARLLITVIGELTIPGLGTRSGMGVQVVTAETGGEDMWKGATTDAIKAAAKLFGVGLELYGPDYEAGEIANAAHANPAPLQQAAPRAPHAPQTNAAPANTPNDPLATESAIKALHAKAGAIRIDHDAIKAIAKHRHGVTSTKELTGRMMYDLMNLLDTPEAAHEAVFAALDGEVVDVNNTDTQSIVTDFNNRHPETDAAPKQSSRTEAAATPRQVQFIGAIARELGIPDDDLNTESRSTFGADAYKLNRRDASIFIERLQQRRAEQRPLGQGELMTGNADRYTN